MTEPGELHYLYMYFDLFYDTKFLKLHSSIAASQIALNIIWKGMN